MKKLSTQGKGRQQTEKVPGHVLLLLMSVFYRDDLFHRLVPQIRTECKWSTTSYDSLLGTNCRGEVTEGGFPPSHRCPFLHLFSNQNLKEGIQGRYRMSGTQDGAWPRQSSQGVPDLASRLTRCGPGQAWNCSVPLRSFLCQTGNSQTILKGLLPERHKSMPMKHSE